MKRATWIYIFILSSSFVLIVAGAILRWRSFEGTSASPAKLATDNFQIETLSAKTATNSTVPLKELADPADSANPNLYENSIAELQTARGSLATHDQRLAALIERQSSFEFIRNNIEDLTTRKLELESELKSIERESSLLGEIEQNFQRQEKFQYNDVVAELERQIQTINTQMLAVQNQLQWARSQNVAAQSSNLAAPNSPELAMQIQNLESQIPYLQIEKEILNSQIRSVGHDSNTVSLSLAQDHQDAKEFNRDQQIELRQRHQLLVNELNNWQQQLSALGDIKKLSDEIVETQSKIEMLNQKINELEKVNR